MNIETIAGKIITLFVESQIEAGMDTNDPKYLNGFTILKGKLYALREELKEEPNDCS